MAKPTYDGLKQPAEAYRRFREARARWNRLVRQANAVLKELEPWRTLDPDDVVEEK